MSILTPELIAQYQSLDGPSVSNAIESFDIRLRNEGFADGRIRSLFPGRRSPLYSTVPVPVNGPAPDWPPKKTVRLPAFVRISVPL